MTTATLFTFLFLLAVEFMKSWSCVRIPPPSDSLSLGQSFPTTGKLLLSRPRSLHWVLSFGDLIIIDNCCALCDAVRSSGPPATRVGTKGCLLKITVVGLGVIGTVAATGFALSGHEVLATDVDPLKVRALGAGMYGGNEPGLADRLKAAIKEGNIRFRHCDDVDETLGEVALIAVGTPQGEGCALELSQVSAAIRWVRDRSNGNLMVAMKSTVPPGTGRGLLQNKLYGTGIGYAANPEFLGAGQALADWDRPDRIVIGTEPGDTGSLEVTRRLYSNFDSPMVFTGIAEAEMLKYASNAFLATRISFMNEIASICGRLGASVDDVSEGLALGSRTGASIFAGVGYGGPCLPKDIGALEHLARQTGAGSDLLRAVIDVNERQWQLPLHGLRDRFGGNLHALKVAILGLSFKPGTGDLTEAPGAEASPCPCWGGSATEGLRPRRRKRRESRSSPDGVQVATDVLTATTGSLGCRGHDRMERDC